MSIAGHDVYLGVIARSFGCADDTARAIAARAALRKFPARAVIAGAGEPDPDAWLILSGQAQAIAYGPGGQYLLVHIFVPGDLFGEAAGLSLASTAAEVSAIDAVDIGQFSAANFVGLMTSHECVALFVTRGLIERLRLTTRRLVEGATLSANGRIYAELLRQARSGTAMTITPAPVFASFALHVQSTRETVSRAVSALEKRGIIKRDGQGLTVIAPHRLEELIY